MMNCKTTNRFYYEKEISERIVNAESIVIYGARIVANEVANCLMRKPYCCRIEAFMVSEKEGNPEELLEKPVITINEGRERFKESLIIVAVLERYMNEIETSLHENGFCNILYFGFESDLWSKIRGNCFRYESLKKMGKYLTLEEELAKASENKKEVHIYSAKCELDQELKDKRTYSWEIPIQVGAALTNKKVCDVRDDLGENISAKNRQYCELTALYWIWKNDKADYTGLCHYRRHFELSVEEITKLGGGDIDVVVTIPILNFPSVRETYKNDHCIEDWDVMLDILQKIHPDYYETALKIQDGNYYYAYNMFIARKEIVNSYCEWLFPVLDLCALTCSQKSDRYQSRFIGFLAERLMTIYFVHHRSQWKLVHIKKNYLK